MGNLLFVGEATHFGGSSFCWTKPYFGEWPKTCNSIPLIFLSWFSAWTGVTQASYALEGVVYG
jgi:hypothetical protein